MNSYTQRISGIFQNAKQIVVENTTEISNAGNVDMKAYWHFTT